MVPSTSGKHDALNRKPSLRHHAKAQFLFVLAKAACRVRFLRRWVELRATDPGMGTGNGGSGGLEPGKEHAAGGDNFDHELPCLNWQ